MRLEQSWNVGKILLFLALLFAGQPPSASAQAVRPNAGFTTTSIPRNDDGSFPGTVPIGFTVNFFGETFSSTFVNNNGNITFGGPLATFTPEGLVASPLRIIAPFWADVDTRAPGSALVTFGQDTVNGRRAFGVNYVNVGYFGSHDDKLNSFQLVLIDRSDTGPGNFDIEFNYDRILWETGDASGGRNGLGGTSASAGYSNGTRTSEGSFEILGSRRNSIFLDSNRNGLRYRRLNSTVRGRLVFFVRQGLVDCTYAALSIDITFPWPGGDGSVQVAAPAGCEWTAFSNASFVTITAVSGSSGNGLVEYTVAPNRSRSARTGTLIVAGQTIVVTQDPFITLKLTPPQLTISSVQGTFPSRVALQLDSLGGKVDWTASATLLNGEGWRLSVSPPSGTVTAGTPQTLVLELNPGFFPPAPAQAVIRVQDNTNGPFVEASVTLAASPPEGRLLLSQTSFVFRATQDGSPAAPQPLQIVNAGGESLAWAIPVGALSSAPWLNFSALSGIVVAGSTTPSSTTLTVNSVGLEAGVYQALVPVTAPTAGDEPKVAVTLYVAPAGTTSSGEVSPNGLVFVAQQGGAAPAAQDLTISNTGAGDLAFQLQPATISGGNWLSLSATGGNAGFVPATVQVRVNPAGLPADIYHGRIRADFPNGKAEIVEVVLVVFAVSGRTFLGTTSCAPQGMDLVATTVGDGASFTVALPGTLLARVLDTCGGPLNNATVTAGVEGTAFALRPVGDGYYRGTWIPEQESPAVPVKITVLHPTYGDFQRTFTVSVAAAPTQVPAPGLPTIAPEGVVEAAGFTVGQPLAPGGVISIFGSRFAEGDNFATRVPLERELAGVRVQIGGEDAPLYYVGPNQINAQVPFTARPGQSVTIVVNTGFGRVSAPQTYLISPAQPGIFNSEGLAVALDGQSRPITFQNPARIGNTLQLFAAGLGAVEPAAQTGAAAPSSSTVINRVTVTIGDVEAPVAYAGLAPGFVGLYQVNVAVPLGVTPGDDVPVVIRQNGISSNPDSPPTIPVRP